jgi:hypothetical protein
VTTLVGYARVSKADGSQVHDLQRDALSAAGVTGEHTAPRADATIGRGLPERLRRCARATPFLSGSSIGSTATFVIW